MALERIGARFESSAASAEHALTIDSANAPAVVWAKDGLLGVGLGSLLDWTAEHAAPECGIELKIGIVNDPRAKIQMVEFSVLARMTNDASSVGLDESETSDDARKALSNLAFETARDAASALGGRLRLERASQGRTISRLRVPQPTTPHP